MKKTICILMLLTPMFMIANSNYTSEDVIYLLLGDSINCKVIEITDKGIMYTFAGETSINNISKLRVSQIQFKSGRVQIITEKIIVQGENDWDKIHITNSSDDVVGLTKVKEYYERSFAMSAPESLAKEKVLEKVKRQAAKNGCHVLLIISFSSTRGAGILADSRANIVAIGYKY